MRLDWEYCNVCASKLEKIFHDSTSDRYLGLQVIKQFRCPKCNVTWNKEDAEPIDIIQAMFKRIKDLENV